MHVVTHGILVASTNGRKYDAFKFYYGSLIEGLCVLHYLVAFQRYPVSHSVGLNVLHHTVGFEYKVGLCISYSWIEML
jgi:hypothetical protein